MITRTEVELRISDFVTAAQAVHSYAYAAGALTSLLTDSIMENDSISREVILKTLDGLTDLMAERAQDLSK